MNIMENKALFDELAALARARGAGNAAVIPVKEIVLERKFRDMCAANACGTYGKCWMCPPDIGDIETLMEEVRTYSYALVYQYVGALEDSYDVEGMADAKKFHVRLAQSLRTVFYEKDIEKTLHLGSGGCGVCTVCAKKTGEPCRSPFLAMSSLEAYGINVSRLAESAGMKYINGANTVTYFGAVLFQL